MTSSSFSFDIIPNICCHYHHHCHHYYCHHDYCHRDYYNPDNQQRDSEEPLLELWPFAVEAANFKVGNLDSYCLLFVFLCCLCFLMLSLSCFVYFDSNLSIVYFLLLPLSCFVYFALYFTFTCSNGFQIENIFTLFNLQKIPHLSNSKIGFVLLISSCVCLKSYITLRCLNKRN